MYKSLTLEIFLNLKFETINIYQLAAMFLTMRTFVVVSLSSEGGSASQVTNKLMDMGFETTLGNHDFVYNWDKNVEPEAVIRFVDDVQKKLQGMNVLLQFVTQ